MKKPPNDGICHACLMRDAELATLRFVLWAEHPCHGKYGDDGELQCGRCGIDFKRDSVEEITKRIADRRLRERITG